MSRVLTWRRDPWSIRFAWRTAIALGCLGAVLLIASTTALMLGDYDLGPAEVWQSLLGRSADPLATYFVQELRAPRVVAGIAVGAALGVAGCLFQGITRNPLGSPDILGFTTGAATGALLQIIVFEGSTRAIAVGALLGGLGTAMLVQALTHRAGLTGQRLVLVGLAVGAFLAAVNTLLVVRASLVAAQTAAQWLAGSLNAMLWPRALLTAGAVAVLLLATIALARPMDQMALGDDIARATGIDAPRVRTRAVLVGVALVSVATAATGPIAFVALAAPQIARRLFGAPSPGIVGSALTGAVIVVVSDVVAQRLFAPSELPVGAVTGALGGLYLIVLLISRRNR
jgi:iron complex transport system permease protein